MDTLESLQNQLKATESKFSGYGADLPGEIQTQLQKAYSPILQESLGVTKNLMGDYLSRYYDTTQMGPGMAGTTAMDLSPTQKLGVMGRELGTMAGDLQATQRYSDYLGGQMNDAYAKAVQAAQLGRQDVSDEYNRILQQYQMAWQQAEAEKDRALQDQMSRRTGGSSGMNPDLIAALLAQSQGNGQASIPTQQQIIADIQNTAQMIASQRGKTSGGVYSYGGQTGDINAFYKGLMNDAKYYGVNLNPEWLWIQLGNTPKALPAGLGSNAYWKETL